MDIVKLYMRFCHNLLGRHIDEFTFDSISNMLYQADLEITAGMFLSMAAISAILASIPMLIFTYIFFGVSLYMILLTVLTVIVVFVGFPFVVYNSTSTKKIGIEKELPFALGYMSILASAGSTPLDILRRMSIENYGEVSKEFRKVIYKIDVLGEDEVSAMNALANNTPSEIFRAIAIDLANIMYSGSGMKEYLQAKSNDLLDIKRQAQKEFVDSLGIFGEGYMGGVLMMVILAVLGIAMSGALNIPIGPFKPKEMFMLLVYGIIPTINIMVYFMLEQKYSRVP